MQRLTVPVFAALAAAALLGLLIYGLTTTGDDTTFDSAVKNGERPVAPSRELPLLQGGGTRSIADYKGKVVVLNFWASWCTPCKAEAPVLDRAQARLARGGQGGVLGATYQDNRPDSLDFVRDENLKYTNVRDVGVKLAEKYGTNKLPETFVIDRQGRIVAMSRGQIDQKFMDQALTEAGVK